MNSATLFWLIVNLGLYLAGLLLLDGAHRAHIDALKSGHREQIQGLRTYIRSIKRESNWLEAELARVKRKAEQREQVSSDPVHIQWLPPSEEYDERE